MVSSVKQRFKEDNSEYVEYAQILLYEYEMDFFQ